MVMLLRMTDLFDLLLSYILSPEGRCIALVGFFENQSKSNIFIKEITCKFYREFFCKFYRDFFYEIEGDFNLK